MTRIEREKNTVRKMIDIYCRRHLHQSTMSEEYQQLSDYACERLDHCQFGEAKGTCKRCTVHCYAQHEREQIRQVMRWTGPRMILYAPKDAIVHMFDNLLDRALRAGQDVPVRRTDHPGRGGIPASEGMAEAQQEDRGGDELRTNAL